MKSEDFHCHEIVVLRAIAPVPRVGPKNGFGRAIAPVPRVGPKNGFGRAIAPVPRDSCF